MSRGQLSLIPSSHLDQLQESLMRVSAIARTAIQADYLAHASEDAYDVWIECVNNLYRAEEAFMRSVLADAQAQNPEIANGAASNGAGSTSNST